MNRRSFFGKMAGILAPIPFLNASGAEIPKIIEPNPDPIIIPSNLSIAKHFDLLAGSELLPTSFVPEEWTALCGRKPRWCESFYVNTRTNERISLETIRQMLANLRPAVRAAEEETYGVLIR